MKVSRYPWPTDRRERIALIIANLTVEIPERRWGPRAKPVKDEVEEIQSDEPEE